MTSRFFIKISALLFITFGFFSAHASYPTAFTSAMQPVQKGITTAELTIKGTDHLSHIHWITAESLIKEINNSKPATVGFDVDDTILFTSAGFVYGKKQFSPDNNSYVNNQAFWKKMNNGWDEFDIPKNIAFRLIHAHQAHGDKIYFVTARPKTTHETLTEFIRKNFRIKHMHPVIFTGNKDKSAVIKKLGITKFYGDADEDIASAKVAGIEGIRIMRAANSTNLPLPHNGNLGEKVVIHSEY